MSSPWLTVNEAASYMRSGVRTIDKLMEKGKLRPYYFDDRPTFRQQDIDDMVLKSKRVRA